MFGGGEVRACRACVGACSSCVGTRVAAYRRGKRVLPLVGACLAGLCASQDPESSSCARPLAGVELWRTRASRAAERCPCGALSTRWALPGSRAVRQSVARTQRPRVAKAVLAGRLSRVRLPRSAKVRVVSSSGELASTNGRGLGALLRC
ncbi:hypothetical protein ACRRTK_014503 [Alexandromys fortis]